MQQLETSIEKLVSKIPYQLPANAKELLVKALPWITLVGAIAMLGVAFVGLQALLFVGSVFGGMMYSGIYAGELGLNSGVWFMAWVAMGLAVVQAVMYIIAFAPLLNRKKFGWNVIFWSTLVSVLTGVANLIYNFNLGSFLGSLIGAVVSLYLLFQVKSYYTAVAVKK